MARVSVTLLASLELHSQEQHKYKNDYQDRSCDKTSQQQIESIHGPHIVGCKEALSISAWDSTWLCLSRERQNQTMYIFQAHCVEISVHNLVFNINLEERSEFKRQDGQCQVMGLWKGQEYLTSQCGQVLIAVGQGCHLLLVQVYFPGTHLLLWCEPPSSLCLPQRAQVQLQNGKN